MSARHVYTHAELTALRLSVTVRLEAALHLVTDDDALNGHHPLVASLLGRELAWAANAVGDYVNSITVDGEMKVLP